MKTVGPSSFATMNHFTSSARTVAAWKRYPLVWMLSSPPGTRSSAGALEFRCTPLVRPCALKCALTSGPLRNTISSCFFWALVVFCTLAPEDAPVRCAFLPGGGTGGDAGSCALRFSEPLLLMPLKHSTRNCSPEGSSCVYLPIWTFFAVCFVLPINWCATDVRQERKKTVRMLMRGCRCEWRNENKSYRKGKLPLSQLQWSRKQPEILQEAAKLLTIMNEYYGSFW